jgi:hypothetical protein
MTAEEHNKTLATLYFVYGGIHGLTLVALLLLVFVAKTATPAADLISPLWATIGIVVFLVLVLAVGLFPLLVGYGFLKRRRWVKPLAITVAIISLVNIPIGTALGIYTFKFFKSEGGVKLYGGKASTASENELQDALRGAQPLADLAKRVRQ